ncbi:MAG TPA: hypothetical protein VFJ93_15735 [Gaiellaceae bacterium]|nr:hypothetical protein [Gaiellaceae bacterium]
MSTLRCGHWVFVHPDERTAPPKIRGLAGTISRISGDRASVAFHYRGATISLEVELAILRPERRRRNRPPADWPHELASTG